MQPDPIALSAAIADIYDAAVEPLKWTAALKSACDFVGGAQAVMFWQGLSVDEVGALHMYNEDADYALRYFERFAPLNPVFPAALFQEVGAVLASSDLVPDKELHETRFYKEWIAPQGFTDSLAVTLERDATRIATLAFPWRAGPIDDAARRRLALLVPHVQRAVAIGRLFVQYKTENAVLTQTLNRVGESVFLLDSGGQVIFANAGGGRLIEEGRLLHARGGRLRALEAEADRALAGGLRAIRDATPIDAQATTFVLEDAPDARWIAHLLPLADGARQQMGGAQRAAAALFVRQSRFADPTLLEALARSCRLTASEIRVVDATLRVSGLDAIADALGVSKATVKTHLNHVYRKCGVKNQSELIKRVAGIT